MNSNPTTWKPRHNPWIIAFTVTLATFMEVMDTAIANVALPHIAGGLSASQNEATWIITSYLVSNAIVLPISGWFSSQLGRKRFYLICVALFTVSSFLCGFAPSLDALIFLRVLQGIGGGGLAPSEQAILADTFPPAKRGMAFAMYGMAVVFAPTIGPTLGGYIVDHSNWRWIFYINVPVGIISLFLSSAIVEDPPWLKGEKNTRGSADWLGLILVTLAFGSLQVVMDKGQENDWFSSNFILIFSLVMTISMVSLVIWELAHPNPVVDVRLFRSRNFALSTILMFTLGMVLYGTTVLLPLFLQTLLGYTAERAGETLSAGGFVTMLLMPVSGFIVSRIPPKYIIAAAFAGMALALYHLSGITLQIDPRTATMYRVYQAINLAFLFIPINTISYFGMPREKNNQISGLMNLARNIGGSVGVAFLSTSLARKSQEYQNYLVDHASQSNSNLQERVATITESFSFMGPGDLSKRVFGSIYMEIQRQATLLSYVHIIGVLAAVCIAFVPLILIFVKRDRAAGTAGAH